LDRLAKIMLGKNASAPTNREKRNNLLNFTETNPEVRRIIIAFTHLRIKWTKIEKFVKDDFARIVSPYLPVTLLMNRYEELLLKVTINQKELEKIFSLGKVESQVRGGVENEEKGDEESVKPPNKKQLIEEIAASIEESMNSKAKKNEGDHQSNKTYPTYAFLSRLTDKNIENRLQVLIADSITCLFHAQTCYSIYDVNHVTNHSMLANGHFKFSYWLVWQKWFKEVWLRECAETDAEKKAKVENYDNLIKSLCGESFSLEMMDIRYHEAQARVNLHQTIETHREGRAYKAMIKKIFLLEDHFTDNVMHFEAAWERYVVNSGWITKKMAEIRLDMTNEREESGYENYFPREAPATDDSSEEE
jgi:hypothetical protein